MSANDARAVQLSRAIGKAGRSKIYSLWKAEGGWPDVPPEHVGRLETWGAGLMPDELDRLLSLGLLERREDMPGYVRLTELGARVAVARAVVASAAPAPERRRRFAPRVRA